MIKITKRKEFEAGDLLRKSSGYRCGECATLDVTPERKWSMRGNSHRAVLVGVACGHSPGGELCPKLRRPRFQIFNNATLHPNIDWSRRPFRRSENAFDPRRPDAFRPPTRSGFSHSGHGHRACAGDRSVVFIRGWKCARAVHIFAGRDIDEDQAGRYCEGGIRADTGAALATPAWNGVARSCAQILGSQRGITPAWPTRNLRSRPPDGTQVDAQGIGLRDGDHLAAHAGKRPNHSSTGPPPQPDSN